MHEGAVDQRIDPAEALDRGGGERIALLAPGDVAELLEHFGLAAERLDARFGIVELVRRACADDDALRAFARRFDRELHAQARDDAGTYADQIESAHSKERVCQYV